MEIYFTFGSDHLDNSGQSLHRTVVIVEADHENEARKRMFSVRGGLWAFSYPPIPQCRETIDRLTNGSYEVLNMKDVSTLARLKVLH